MNRYKVFIRYNAHIYFEEYVDASNDNAAMKQAERHIDIKLRSICETYDINDDEVYIEKMPKVNE
jgi:hypothetical protein